MSKANIANMTATTTRTPVAGKANWIAQSVSTIPESIRFGVSVASAATAIRVVETVSSNLHRRAGVQR